MASPGATAERYAAAQSHIAASMARISKSTGIALPPPIAKTDANDAKAAYEAERVAVFLAQVASNADGGGVAPLLPAGDVPGQIGDGYNHAEATAKAKPPAPSRERPAPVRTREEESEPAHGTKAAAKK